MRRLIMFILALLAIPAAAQSGQRTASPPVVTVELSGVEPRPSSFPAEMFYGGLGGGGANPLVPYGVYWSVTPDAYVGGSDAFLMACGYSNMQQPTGTLTSPSGKQTALAPTDVDTQNNCFSYTVPWSYGMELGLYSLTLDHSDGSLSYTWGMDYPFCRTMVPVSSQQWLMGYAPGEQLTVAFFAPLGGDAPGFVAVRNVQADSEGALALDIKVARSAPFSVDDLSFAVIGPQGQVYFPPDDSFDMQPFTDLGYVRIAQPVPPPLYPTYSTPQTIRNNNGCNGTFGPYVEAVPSDGRSIVLYADVNSTSQIGQLPTAAPARVLENRPAITNGRTVVWKHLLTEDGTTGWTASLDFVGANIQLLPGSRVEVLPLGVEDPQTHVYHPSNPLLFSAPDAGAQRVEIAQGMLMTAFGYRIVDTARWWYLRADDGRAGWIPEVDPVSYNPTLNPLPWKPVDVDQPGAPWQTCPNSPPTRLVPPVTAQVTPGDSNRVRSAPENGTVIGQIPPGASFIINEGPVCGASQGLTWWKVTYNDLNGWTAEGQADQYWLEPVPTQYPTS